jgi:predicted pyridoxine 5'-phosphate oxidase superfamily flavin-nucleotide-binding protein
VRVRDKKTVLIPDRRGNNRVDTLRNLVRDPRIALLFMIPGSATLRERSCPSQCRSRTAQSFAVETRRRAR